MGSTDSGVPTERNSERPRISAAAAARALNCDVRTVRRAIVDGTIEGYVVPRRERRRWFVYSDQINRASPTQISIPVAQEETNLEAQIAALQYANLKLIAANADLHAAATSGDLASSHLRTALNHLRLADQARTDQIVALHHANEMSQEALAQYMTPQFPEPS